MRGTTKEALITIVGCALHNSQMVLGIKYRCNLQLLGLSDPFPPSQTEAEVQRNLHSDNKLTTVKCCMLVLKEALLLMTLNYK